MSEPSKAEEIKAIHTAIGSALSNWTRVEIQLYQIFSASLTLTIMQPGGGYSSDARIPVAVLDAIDGFRSKILMIDKALTSALGDLDDTATSILNDWAKEKEKVQRLHTGSRSRLAHWTVASGFPEGAQVRLVPPSYSTREHQGITLTDIQQCEAAFVEAQNRLISIVERLTSHQGLQRKFLRQVASQVRCTLPGDQTAIEFLKRELS